MGLSCSFVVLRPHRMSYQFPAFHSRGTSFVRDTSLDRFSFPPVSSFDGEYPSIWHLGDYIPTWRLRYYYNYYTTSPPTFFFLHLSVRVVGGLDAGGLPREDVYLVVQLSQCLLTESPNQNAAHCFFSFCVIDGKQSCHPRPPVAGVSLPFRSTQTLRSTNKTVPCTPL